MFVLNVAGVDLQKKMKLSFFVNVRSAKQNG